MDKINTEKLKKTIIDYLSQRNIKLNRLVLFGSYAAGKNTEESDVDIIIVSEDFRNRNYSERIINSLGINRVLVKSLDLPIDVIYYSDEEWENSETLLIREAKQYGMTIYN